MARIPEGNDRRPAFRGRRPGASPQRGRASAPEGFGWIWGRHAVQALVENAHRPPPRRILALPDRAKALDAALVRRADWLGAVRLETTDASTLNQLLPQGSVHQGVAVLAADLASPALEDVAAEPRGVIVMLDEVTDPQNVGAILRSAAAFSAKALIVQDRHAPGLHGALAKAAAGAVERTPVVRVTNLSRALERLQDLGWTSIGLSGTAPRRIEDALPEDGAVLVLGSEGEGLRRLVAEHCDGLAKIDMPGGFESLNVSAAAAVALYAASLRRGVPAPGE